MFDELAPHSIVICKSTHHGNTRKVADRIAAVLNTNVVDPDEYESCVKNDVVLLGIGSGIYFGRFHRSIRRWVNRLPENAGKGHQAFIFSTSGLRFLSVFYHLPLKRKLRSKGYEVIDEFACSGHDTFALLCLIGGLNRKHPNQRDLQNAERFARSLMEDKRATPFDKSS